jgi:hypothetical protein
MNLSARDLPIAGIALWIAILLAFTASALSSQASASRGSHRTAHSRTARRGAKGGKSGRRRCAGAVARGRVKARRGRRLKIGKCLIKDSERSTSKPRASQRRAPVVGGGATRDAVEAPGSESGSTGSPGASGESSGESSAPGSPAGPAEPGGPGPTEPIEVGPTELTPPTEPATSQAVPFRFFSAASFWNVPLAVGAAVDPASAGVVGAFDEGIAMEERAGSGPWINTTSYSIPVYTVPVGQPVVPVVLDGEANAPLSAAWSAVPLPSTAVPAVGHDGSLVLWQPSKNRLWEFHQLVHEGGVWKASWGGAMQSVSSDAGVYGPEAWPGAQSWWGISASSLSLVGGLISLEDLERGQINHALEIAIPHVRAGVFASPAQRTDGKSGSSLSLPEGARLRLDPSLNLAALHLPRLTLMIAEAAQRYGIFVTDGSSDVEFYAQDPTPTGTNPYPGPSGYFEGKHPNQLLASFPWNHLELLKMELHSKKSSKEAAS